MTLKLQDIANQTDEKTLLEGEAASSRKAPSDDAEVA